jgi:hypothetical protein
MIETGTGIESADRSLRSVPQDKRRRVRRRLAACAER